MTRRAAHTRRIKVGTANCKLAACAAIIGAVILALAVVGSVPFFPPPECAQIGGVVVIAGKCP
jgi:hypothetical protein